MKFKFKFILLLFAIIIASCTDSNLEKENVETLSSLEPTPLKQLDSESYINSDEDLEVQFLKHVIYVNLMTQNEDPNYLIDDLLGNENISLSSVLSSVSFSKTSIELIESTYKLIENGKNLGKVSSSLSAKIEQLEKLEETSQVIFDLALLKGYYYQINNASVSATSRNPCVDKCVIQNAYGWLWWVHYNFYVQSNPGICWGQQFCWQASSYANTQVRLWCLSKCGDEVIDPPVDYNPTIIGPEALCLDLDGDEVGTFCIEDILAARCMEDQDPDDAVITWTTPGTSVSVGDDCVEITFPTVEGTYTVSVEVCIPIPALELLGLECCWTEEISVVIYAQDCDEECYCDCLVEDVAADDGSTYEYQFDIDCWDERSCEDIDDGGDPIVRCTKKTR